MGEGEDSEQDEVRANPFLLIGGAKAEEPGKER
jgi:hypothetical protein